MKFNINEISNILKEEIKQYKAKMSVSKVGRVVGVGDGIATIYGLDDVMAGEMLEFENGIHGEVFNLEEHSVGAVIYGDFSQVREGSDVRSTSKLLSVPVGEALLGRVVNALCEPVDGGPPIKADAASRHSLETSAALEKEALTASFDSCQSNHLTCPYRERDIGNADSLHLNAEVEKFQNGGI